MKSEINIKQIAYLSGYSKSTVSKALNNSREVSEKTKRKIQKIADAYNYKPNSSAKALKSKKAHTIGLIIPEFSKTQYAHLMEGIEEEAVRKKYRLAVYQSKNNLWQKRRSIRMFFDGSIDGLIIVTNERFASSCEIDYVNQILEDSLPSIKINFSDWLHNNGSPNTTKNMGKEVFKKLVKML